MPSTNLYTYNIIIMIIMITYVHVKVRINEATSLLVSDKILTHIFWFYDQQERDGSPQLEMISGGLESLAISRSRELMH